MKIKQIQYIRFITSILFLIGIYSVGYSQKTIEKNGIKINKLDKKNKKQGSWFFFDEFGEIALSCYYKNDSIIDPIVFYKNQDSTFIRYPKVNNSEMFLVKSNKKWVVGRFEKIKKDSLQIDILGYYKKIGQNSIDIIENDSLSNSVVLKKEACYWIKKEVYPIYMFGNETMSDFFFRVFSSSKYLSNKKIYIDLIINESGGIEKITFPRLQNNLSFNEENELDFLFHNMMGRWQPFFSENKTVRFKKHIESGLKFK